MPRGRRRTRDGPCRRAVPGVREEIRPPAFDKSKLGELKAHHVQDVFPDWSPADRELYFMSGICGACWGKMMTPSEDSDEEA